ncbi:MAG: apolipoprotein N-acyltransferase [Rhizomicrobium sp.]
MIAALSRIGNFFRALTGWRALLASIVAGGFYALGFAPLGIFPAMLLGLAALVLLLDGAAPRRRPVWGAAAIGWGFGFGQFLVGMHWIFYPFLVDPIEHAWQIPFVAILFPGGLALFAAAACAAAMAAWRPGRPRIFILTVCYAAAEWLRGHVLTGLPWNLPAYGWGASLAILQSTAFFGAYGLSLLTVFFGASLAELFEAPRPRLGLPVAAVALFAALWLGGTARLWTTPTSFVANVHLRLVQPNIPQDEKYVRHLVARNWQRLMELSTRPGGATPGVIIWPEAAPPVLLQRSPDALAQIAELTGGNRVLVTGNQREDADANGERRFFNSLFVFGAGGARIATYDKFHLVPFGEYLPLESWLRYLGITKLVGFPGSFSAGDGPHTLDIPGAPPASPLICYEILFPSAVVAAPRPMWILNVTDDSWFGPWAGPAQHLLAARVRAIEEGLPLARAANTGISAVVDAQGRIIARLGLDRTGIVDALLPKADGPTPYARFADLVFFLLLILCAALPMALSRR